MDKNADHLSVLVLKVKQDPTLSNSLSEQIVPVMMHLTLDNVHRYHKELEPILETLQPGSEAYSYLLVILSFSEYRCSSYHPVIETLTSYELEYAHCLSVPLLVSINALIGACYRSLGQAEFSLEYFQRNIPYTQIERKDHEYFYSLTLYHIAELYGELQEYEAMLDRHKLNLLFFESAGKGDFYFRTLNGVGKAYQGLTEYESALKYLLDVERESSDKGNIPFRARNLHDLGGIYAKLNKVDKSLAYFEKAFKLRTKHKLVNASLSTTIEMGRLLIKDSRLAHAISLLTDAMNVAEEIGVQKKQFVICKLLSEAYERDGQIHQALEYYKKYHAIKALVDNVDYTKAENQRVREINTVLEEQKKIIEEQKVKIEESHQSIQALNENLEALVQERTSQLMQRHEQLKHYAFMNAHEVRGPLSTILGLLQISSEFSSLEEKEELIQMIEQSTLKLDRTIKDMHEGLTKFSQQPKAL